MLMMIGLQLRPTLLLASSSRPVSALDSGSCMSDSSHDQSDEDDGRHRDDDMRRNSEHNSYLW